jgi:fructose-bisphosphate aldolase class II
MPIATPEVYAAMLDAAKANSYAFPAINITSSQTLNAALAGFAEAGSDGIIQVSTGGAEYASGPTIKNMVTGAVALAEYAHVVAKNYPINIAVHTDHCPKDKLPDTYVRPLIDISIERVKNGQNPLFQSHMWDGSAVSRTENLSIAQELLELTNKAHQILEIEVGVVGGEEDGVANEINEKLYSTVEDGSPRSRPSASARTAATSPRSPSATCTACTSRVRSSSVRQCSRRSRTRSAPSTARTSRSPSSSTAAPAQAPRRSRTRSTTAS